VVDTLVGTAGADLLQETSGDGVVTAGAGDDTIDGGHGDDTIAGGDGVDLARYGGARAGYDLAWSDGVRRVTDRGGVEGSDRLDGVERLQFADRKVAVDVLLANELQGNAAGITAKVLGAVFGRDAVAIAEYAGIGLQLLDAGVSYEQLMQLALQVRLGADFTLDAEVSLFYRTLAGAEATPADLAFWSGFVGAAGLTPAQLGVLAADTALNAANVGLAGLQQAGLEYL
jgi:hypothetical protein